MHAMSQKHLRIVITLESKKPHCLNFMYYIVSVPMPRNLAVFMTKAWPKAEGSTKKVGSKLI